LNLAASYQNDRAACIFFYRHSPMRQLAHLRAMRSIEPGISRFPDVQLHI
jgi:hypothetical protein